MLAIGAMTIVVTQSCFNRTVVLDSPPLWKRWPDLLSFYRTLFANLRLDQRDSKSGQEREISCVSVRAGSNESWIPISDPLPIKGS